MAAVSDSPMKGLCRPWARRVDSCPCFQGEEAVVPSSVLEDRGRVSQVAFHSMFFVSLDALHDLSDRGPVGRLGSVPEGVAISMCARYVYHFLVSNDG